MDSLAYLALAQPAPSEHIFPYLVEHPHNAQESHLLHLSQSVIRLLNAHDFTNPFFTTHVSPHVRVDLQGHITVGLDGFIGNYRHDGAQSSSFKVELGNCTVMVDEELGTATTICSQYLKGYRGDERRMAGTILMLWVWEEWRWVCRSVTMLLGTPEFLV